MIKLLEKGWDISYLYLADGRHGGNIDPEKIKKNSTERGEKGKRFSRNKGILRF